MNKKKQVNYRETILGIVVGFLILFLIFQKMWLAWIAAIIGLLALLSNTFAGWVHRGWGYFTRALGWVNSRILLSLIFFLLLTPISFLRRLFSGNSVLHLKDDSDSYFKVRDHQFEGKDLENPW